MPDLRKDPIVGRWVIIATERARRPAAAHRDAAPPAGVCPFCPGQEAKTPPEILAYRPSDGPSARRDVPGWSLRVFPNRYPALKIEGALDRSGDGMYDRMNGIGAHEVLVETPDHRKSLADLSVGEIAQVLGAFRDRILDLKRDTRFRYVMVFKNHRAASGATLAHTHSQLIALPTVPKNVVDELAGSLEYFRFKERCVFCDIVHQELSDRRRVVFESTQFLVAEPYAPKFPFETWIVPRQHRAAFEDAPEAELVALGAALRIALRKLRRALDDPPYNFILHSAPFGNDPSAGPIAQAYHWHIEIMPKLTEVAGFEWGSGFYINPTPPEEAARFLRDLDEEWKAMRVLHIASEVAPYSKTGGLADVAGSLPRALAALGDEVLVVTPRYLADPDRFALARRLRRVRVTLGKETIELEVLEGRLPGGGGTVRALLVDHPLYHRNGLYGHGGVDYPDNALRFALLSYGALAAARAFGFAPEVIHAHDWQAAPSLLYARRGIEPEARTILTIHNVVFTGRFPASTAAEVGFGTDLYRPDGIEFFGSVSFLKAGLIFADWITTVSPRYAREIQTPEFGAGLDGLLRSRSDRLVGILNGADYDAWAPERDPAIAAPYRAGDLGGKRACKQALQRELGLPARAATALTATVARLTHQKGVDLLCEALEELLGERDMQVAILGSGEAALEERLTALAARFPSKLGFRIGYDEGLAHRIYAGADLFVMPSRYEPCGLAQLYALRYGTPPIVRATGGLDDTVVDFDPRSRTGTGFKFAEPTAAALIGAWRRALVAHSDRMEFAALARRAMEQDFSWSRSARAYRALYGSQ